MVKHNNVISSGNVKKDWQRHVKTWFNQPARKQRRRIGEQPTDLVCFLVFGRVLAFHSSSEVTVCDLGWGMGSG